MKKKEVIKNYKDSPKYLNVGGGLFVREHWRVLDYITEYYNYPKILVDYNFDLESLSAFPIQDNSYDLVYISHVLEHLSDKAVIHTLRECYRILKPGGGIRIVAPDIDLALYHYEKGHSKWFEILYPNDKYRNHPNWLEIALLIFFASHLVERSLIDDYNTVRQDFENLPKHEFLNKYKQMIKDDWQRENPGFHRNWFNYERLKELLESVGLKNIMRSECRKSIFIEMNAPEFDRTHPEMSLYVDAIK